MVPTELHCYQTLYMCLMLETKVSKLHVEIRFTDLNGFLPNIILGIYSYIYLLLGLHDMRKICDNIVECRDNDITCDK